jgi:prepilin-type N-terminal cleavage/methylation domain-containing protein
MRKLKIQNQDGLTLLEVLIALLILSLSLLLLLNMAMVALDGNDWANNTTLTTHLMQEKLEQLRSTNNPGSGVDTARGVVRSWTVNNAGANLNEIKIRVDWEDVRGTAKQDSLTAYLKS